MVRSRLAKFHQLKSVENEDWIKYVIFDQKMSSLNQIILCLLLLEQTIVDTHVEA